MAASKKTAKTVSAKPAKFDAKAFLAVATKRPGSNAEVAAKFLASHYGKPVEVEKLCLAVYGEAYPFPAIGMVLNGINGKLAEAGLKFKIVRAKGTVQIAA